MFCCWPIARVDTRLWAKRVVRGQKSIYQTLQKITRIRLVVNYDQKKTSSESFG